MKIIKDLDKYNEFLDFIERNLDTPEKIVGKSSNDFYLEGDDLGKRLEGDGKVDKSTELEG